MPTLISARGPSVVATRPASGETRKNTADSGSNAIPAAVAELCRIAWK
jgi:hypothetical protein